MLLAFLIGMWSGPLVVMTVMVVFAVLSDWRTRRRVAREDSARAHAVAVRLEADEHWAGVESEWHRYVNDFAPTMGHDPERLGGAS